MEPKFAAVREDGYFTIIYDPDRDERPRLNTGATGELRLAGRPGYFYTALGRPSPDDVAVLVPYAVDAALEIADAAARGEGSPSQYRNAEQSIVGQILAASPASSAQRAYKLLAVAEAAARTHRDIARARFAARLEEILGADARFGSLDLGALAGLGPSELYAALRCIRSFYSDVNPDSAMWMACGKPGGPNYDERWTAEVDRLGDRSLMHAVALTMFRGGAHSDPADVAAALDSSGEVIDIIEALAATPSAGHAAAADLANALKRCGILDGPAWIDQATSDAVTTLQAAYRGDDTARLRIVTDYRHHPMLMFALTTPSDGDKVPRTWLIPALAERSWEGQAHT